MSEEHGCWNCKYDEIPGNQEPCYTCDVREDSLSKWERGQQTARGDINE